MIKVFYSTLILFDIISILFKVGDAYKFSKRKQNVIGDGIIPTTM